MHYVKKTFTLVELVIIMVILALIGAVVINPLSNLGAMRARQAAYKIKSDLRFAQTYALMHQERTRISFATGGYSVYRETSPYVWALLKDPLTQQDFTVDYTLGEYRGVTIAQINFDGQSDLVFDARGEPYSYSAGALTPLAVQGVVAVSGAGTAVLVEPETGKVSLG